VNSSLIVSAGGPFPFDPHSHRVIEADGPLALAVREARPDIVVMAARLADAALAALLEEPLFAALPVILVAAPDDADAVGLLLTGRIQILEAPAGALALADAIAAATGAPAVADAGSGYAPADRIAALKRDADRVAAALGELVAGSADDAMPRAVDPGRIRAHIKARRLRDRFFDPELFADPAWDMLLDLSAARLEGRQVSVSSLCIAAAVPTTTALRWIKALVDRGLFLRESDPADARRAFIGMESGTADRMLACLDAVLNQPGQ
jgi:hypothetical protein